MAVQINLEVREHEDRRVSLTRAQLAGYTEATGLRVTEKYTGPWAAMLERTLALAAESATEEALSLDLERHGGEVGELTVTRTEYRQPSGGEEAELGTAANPVYTSSSSVTEEPLLAHPKFSGVTAEDAELLHELESGTTLQTVVAYKGKLMPLRKALGQLTGQARLAANYYYKGKNKYMAAHAEATARWTGGGNHFTAGKIETPPGNVSTPAGCNWLCTGTGKEKNGKEVVHTATFMLSAPGGWDEYLYGQN